MKAGLFLIVVALVMVTAAREVSLFTSFANSDRDVFLATVFGIALVMAKPLLAGAAMTISQTHRLLSAVCALLVLPLMLVSVAGTALYFESAYQTRAIVDQQSDAGYQSISQIIAQKRASADQMKAVAAAAAERGNTWYAGEQLRLASDIEAQIPALINLLSTERVATSAATVGGSAMQEWRWVAWVGIAVLADLLQIVGVLLLKTQQNTENRTLKTAENKTTKQTKNTGLNKTERKPEQNTEQKPDQENWLANHIRETGELPTVRAAKGAGVTYQQYTHQVQQLLNLGVIEQKSSGRGWAVVNSETPAMALT